MAEGRETPAPIILVPGFWLGEWAWDEVAAALRADGHEVTAMTLPGLDSVDTDRSGITMSAHVDAIVDVVRAANAPVVLAVHSGTGFAGYAASDRVPERIAAMVYVDSAPGIGAMDADFGDVEKPLPSKEEPRRTKRGATRDLPAASGSPAGWRPPRGSRADQRRASRCTHHGHLHGVYVRAGEGLREGAQPGLARRPRRAA